MLGGYLLGRTKKLRLALTLGSMLAGQRLANNRQDLLAQGSKLLEANPQLKELQNQLTGRLVDVAREAALVAVASRVESLTKSLQPRQASGEGGQGDEGEDIGSTLGTLTGSLTGRRRGRGGESQEGETEGEASDGQEESDQGDDQMGDQEESDQAADQMGDEEESDEGDQQADTAGDRGESDEGERAGGSSGSGFGGSPSQTNPPTKKPAAKASKGLPRKPGKQPSAPRTRTGR